MSRTRKRSGVKKGRRATKWHLSRRLRNIFHSRRARKRAKRWASRTCGSSTKAVTETRGDRRSRATLRKARPTRRTRCTGIK